MVLGRVISGKGLIRKIEALPTQSDKPIEPVQIADCGQLTAEEVAALSEGLVSTDGDVYEEL